MSQGDQHHGRYVGVAGLLVLVLIIISAAVMKSNGAGDIAPGSRMPPFALPLALGDVNGDANIATRANEGSAGREPACSIRGAGILNVCELYERDPLVLALFLNAGSCPEILTSLQALVPSFPGVRFAAVAIKGDRNGLRQLVSARKLSFPVGIDRDGVLARMYEMVSCPQVNFALPGGVVQSRALLVRPSQATLRARVRELVSQARARGWRPPSG